MTAFDLLIFLTFISHLFEVIDEIHSEHTRGHTSGLIFLNKLPLLRRHGREAAIVQSYLEFHLKKLEYSFNCDKS